MHNFKKDNTHFVPQKIACFGELLLRFSPDAVGNWVSEHAMPAFIGGAELNVASALGLWGIDTTYLTALPDHLLGRQLQQAVADRNIDASRILFADGRVGAYYLPQGADLKSAGVIYDRAGSSFASLKPGTIDWQPLLQGIDWLHFSAICPALTADAALICKEILVAANQMGIITSIDLNYRAKLWQYGKNPVEVIPDLAQHCNLVMGNVWAAETMLGIKNHLQDAFPSQEQCLQQAAETSQEIMNDYPLCSFVANTFRFSESESVDYYAVVQTKQAQVVSKSFQTNQVADKSGSGDCFMAGLIYAAVNGFDLQDMVNFAAAAAFGKLQVKGDNTNQLPDAIKQNM